MTIGPQRDIGKLFVPAAKYRRAGERLVKWQRPWRTQDRRFYPLHAEVEPHAPILLGMMFASGTAESEPAGCYRYDASHTGQHVRLNVTNWRWLTLDATAEGHGLYELWAWRWGLPLPTAATDLWVAIQAHEVAP